MKQLEFSVGAIVSHTLGLLGGLALLCLATPALGNIVITSGGSYSPQITGTGILVEVKTTEQVTISGANLTLVGSNSTAIQCDEGSNVAIENTEFDADVDAPPTCTAVYAYEDSSCTVQNCDFRYGQGVIFQGPVASTNAYNQVIRCTFLDMYIAVQFAGLLDDPNLYCYYNLVVADGDQEQTDQISLYYSSGRPNYPILVNWNLVESYPNSNFVIYSTGINAGDGPLDSHGYPKQGEGSTLVEVEYNTVLNGGGSGLGTVNQYGVGTFTGNTIIGIGYSGAVSQGNYSSVGIGAASGTWSGNLCAWWDQADGKVYNVDEVFGFTGLGQSSEVMREGKQYITLSNEEAAYSTWRTAVGGTIGGSNPASPTYPAAAYFDF